MCISQPQVKYFVNIHICISLQVYFVDITGIFSKSSVYYPFIIGLLIIIAINIAVAIIILSMYIINLMRKKKQSTPVNLTSPKMLSNIRATFGTMPSTAGNSVGGPVSLLSKCKVLCCYYIITVFSSFRMDFLKTVTSMKQQVNASHNYKHYIHMSIHSHNAAVMET